MTRDDCERLLTIDDYVTQADWRDALRATLEREAQLRDALRTVIRGRADVRTAGLGIGIGALLGEDER